MNDLREAAGKQKRKGLQVYIREVDCLPYQQVTTTRYRKLHHNGGNNSVADPIRQSLHSSLPTSSAVENAAWPALHVDKNWSNNDTDTPDTEW